MSIKVNGGQWIVGIVRAPVGNLCIVRPHIFGSSHNFFFRACGRRHCDTTNVRRQFIRSGVSGSRCNIVEKLRFRGPPCSRTGLMRIVGNDMCSITISLHDNSPACKR